MKIFGIGLNKTGTTTLGHCFSSLGYRHLSVRRDLLIAYREGRIDDVFSVIDEYDTFEDWPYPLMYRELAERYEDAKFVLTIRRDEKTWLRSLRKHALTASPFNHCRKLAYGYEYPFENADAHLAFYSKHNSDVATYFAEHGAQDRLLTICWETGDGWEELAGFLGVDAPAEEIPTMNPASRISWTAPKQLVNRWRSGFWGQP